MSLNSYISSITNQIEYFKYSFKVASSLINNTILLYGAYELSHNKLIVTIEKYNKEECLHSFSHSMNTILCLNDECLDILTSDGIYLTFQDIFKYKSVSFKISGAEYDIMKKEDVGRISELRTSIA